MLKAQLFHANALDKLPKLHEQINQFLGHLDESALVSVNATEFGPAGTHEFYSYTVLMIYRSDS